jgi:hypothetical protein
MKDGVAVLAANFIRWKREHWLPSRDLILALTADEEAFSPKPSIFTQEDCGQASSHNLIGQGLTVPGHARVHAAEDERSAGASLALRLAKSTITCCYHDVRLEMKPPDPSGIVAGKLRYSEQV